MSAAGETPACQVEAMQTCLVSADNRIQPLSERAFMNARIGRIVFSTVCAVVCTLGSQASQAHHGWGDYDDEQPLTLKAKVAELAYANPHASMVIDAGGKRWNAILAPISRMESRGASRKALEVNQEITARAGGLVGSWSLHLPGSGSKQASPAEPLAPRCCQGTIQ
jgi:hypothetical protein